MCWLRVYPKSRCNQSNILHRLPRGIYQDIPERMRRDTVKIKNGTQLYTLKRNSRKKVTTVTHSSGRSQLTVPDHSSVSQQSDLFTVVKLGLRRATPRPNCSPPSASSCVWFSNLKVCFNLHFALFWSKYGFETIRNVSMRVIVNVRSWWRWYWRQRTRVIGVTEEKELLILFSLILATLPISYVFNNFS